MRTLLKVNIPVEQGNKAILDGSLPKIIQTTMDRLKPEAAYFTTNEGKRTAFFVFDLKDASDIPPIAEPFFMGLNAAIEFSPVMTAEDLKKGLMGMAG